MVKKILAVLAALLVAFVGFVATRPAQFRIERSATIAAPIEAVFPLVDDFHRWADWSPWEKLDPGMKKTFEGGPGVGAKYAWVGNQDAGEGRMTILESRPGERIGIKLEFLKPFAATNTTVFAFKGGPDGTHVNWSMEGQNNFLAKAFSVFMNMDAMVGKDFEAGLRTLKNVAEAEAAKAGPAVALPPAAASPGPSPAK